MTTNPADTRNRSLPLALTMGDPAGIGLEITLKAWAARRENAVPPFLLYADPATVAERARMLSIAVEIEETDGSEPLAGVFNTALAIKPIKLAVAAIPGHPNSANAGAIVRAIETAVSDTLSAKAAAVVTNPISKAVLYDSGFAYPGHTEFLAALAARFKRAPSDAVHKPVMMLAGGGLRVVPATIHIPLRDVSRSLTPGRLETTLRIVESALRTDFAIDRPRIAVSGLNPHAGEHGTMGDEEERIIAPVVDKLKAEGLDIAGPLPADTMFHPAARQRYDAAVCMYHDQALIPLKTLAFDEGVNMTLGLPLVRTSPDHGTAFDIASQGIASPKSLIASLHQARALADNRSAKHLDAAKASESGGAFA